MHKTFFLLLFAVTAIFLGTSCASTPEKRPQVKRANVENHKDSLLPDEPDVEQPEYKSPFFEDEDEDTYYENEDEDDPVAFEWFIAGLKGFWDFFTYPGRVIHNWGK